jgi:DNA-binding XRE family transcriptional regulator
MDYFLSRDSQVLGALEPHAVDEARISEKLSRLDENIARTVISLMFPLSEHEMAEKMGGYRALIGQFRRYKPEAGDVPNPTLRALICLSEALDLELHHLALLDLSTAAGVQAQRRVGKKVRQLRQARGWSQTALGRAARMSRTIIAQLESGDFDLKLSQFVALQYALDVNIEELVDPYVVSSPKTVGRLQADPLAWEARRVATLAHLAGAIRAIRMEKGVATAQISILAGLPYWFVGDIERVLRAGAPTNEVDPTIAEISAIAVAGLNSSAFRLFSGLL